MPLFTDSELDAARIDKMILHVVGGADFTPESLMPVDGFEEFFLEQIRAATLESLFSFRDDSFTKATIEEIESNEMSFEKGGQTLAQRFHEQHRGNARDGAFFVFRLVFPSIAEDAAYVLIKFDYQKVMELYEDDGRNALRQIIQAFVSDKRAIQKFAMVRVASGTALNSVAARDRSEAQPDLTEYFEAYLGVRRERSETEMSEALLIALRRTIQEGKDFFPNRDVPLALQTAQNALKNRITVDEDAVVEAIHIAAGRPTDADARIALARLAKRKMKDQRLTGVEFAPVQSVLEQKPKRKLNTKENVTVLFPEELLGDAVKIENLDGKAARIIIETTEIVDNGVVTTRSR